MKLIRAEREVGFGGSRVEVPAGCREAEKKAFGLTVLKIGEGAKFWGVLKESERRFRRRRVNGDCAIFFWCKER